jgi:non-reducing end alpha-L-arabinofuranosidase
VVLRDTSGLVVDSLNYGGLVDPWAAAGYQAASGSGHGGCFVPTPGPNGGFSSTGSTDSTDRSAGRFPDGADSDSNCSDFLVHAATHLPLASAAGVTDIKVANVAGFEPSQTIQIDKGARI